MKKMILFTTLFFFALQALGGEVWVTTNSISTPEKLNELTERYRSEVRKGDFISAFEVQLGHPATADEMAVILDLDSLGRAASLNGNFKSARGYYLKLAEKLKSIPNVAGVEKITLSTLINLAHVSTLLRRPDRDARWREAHSWSPKAKLSPEEFSPAIILQFSKPPQAVTPVKISFQVDNAAVLFVDGQSLKGDLLTPGVRTTILEPGFHQASALLPGTAWEVKTFEVRAKNATTLSLSPKLLATGTCQSPVFSEDAAKSKAKLIVHYDDDCSLVLKNKKWFKLNGETVAAEETAPSGHASILPEKLLPQPEGETLVAEPNHKNIFSSGWFWIGLSAVVVSAAVVISAQSQTSTVPTHITQ